MLKVVGRHAARWARLVWQVLVRRELEEAAKVLGERIRTNEASSEVGAPAGSPRLTHKNRFKDV